MAKEIREIIAFQEQLANGDPVKLARLDDLRNAVNYAEKKGALAEGLPKDSFEFKPTQVTPETSITQLAPSERDRKLRNALLPFVQEYKAVKVHTPELVNATWQGIWREIGKRVRYEYQVPECDRTTEELAQLKREGRAVLLLPNDIYTPDGLVRLGLAFPLMNSWVTKPEEAAKISHSSSEGGSVDIEMSLDAPYRTSKGLNEQELRDRITADGKRGIRLPTYLVGSQFSQLLTGHYFDENTLSRTPGSFYDGRALNADFGSGGGVSVDYWGRGDRGSDLGGRSEGVKRF